MPETCNQNDCPLTSRVEALEEANRQHSVTHREIFDRLRAQETLAAVQENKLDTILHKLDALTEKVEAMEAKPAKRWDSLVGCVISAIAGAFLVWLASGMPGVGK